MTASPSLRYHRAAPIALLLVVSTLFASANAAVGSARVRANARQESRPLTQESDGHVALSERRIAFEENVGQTDSRVRFVARAGSVTAFVLPDALVLRTSMTSPVDGAKSEVAAAVRLQFEGAAPNAPVSGEDMLPGQAHYFIGSDSSRWYSGVRTYGRVRARNVYEGVDAVYYQANGNLEYDFVVAPHADPAQIRFAITGGESVSVDESGDLVIETPAGELRQRAPRLYQETDSGRMPVSGGFRLLGAGRVGLAVGGYDPGRPLVIDPVVDFGTRIGGSLSDTALDVAVDASGEVYAVGYSGSVDFPVTVGVPSEFRGSGSDTFVTKLDASGQVLLFSAYVGGSGVDLGKAIALAADGGVVVCGYTSSSDFPIAAGIQPAPGNPASGGDGFVLKLTATGSALTYSTYLGGSGDDGCMDVAAVGDGSIVVCGGTGSSDFPTQLPLFGYSGDRDAFISRIAPGGGAFIFSTLLGGSLYEEAASVSIDANGNILVAGQTSTAFEYPTPAIPFPVVNAVTPVFGGQTDAFAAKLSPTGQVLHYSTPLGGRGVEYAYDTCVDTSGSLYVVGTTASVDFPVAGPIASSLGSGSTDGFVTKLSPAGDALNFSRFIGGSGSDALVSVAILQTGSIAAFGYSNSTDVPLANEFQSIVGGAADGLMAVLSPADGAAQTVSYFGDTASESFSSVASDPTGGIIALMNAGGPVFPGGGNAEFGPGGGADPLVYRFYLEDRITPPTSPASLSAAPASPFRISLAWTDTSGVENAIAIERRDGPAAPWIQIALTGPNVVSFNDDTVSASSTYSYRVRNIAGPDRSDASNEVDATTPASSGLPVAPSFLSAAAVAGPHVALGWSDASADETGFEVERRLEPAGPWIPIGTSAANVASYRDVSPTVPATLGYRVRAVNGAGPSAWSNTAVVTTVNPPTPPPAAPIVEQDVNDSSRVKISWTAAAGVVTSYRIERRVGADPTWRLILSASTQSTTSSDDDVNRDVTYHYRVRSANSAGVSAPTPEAGVTVLPPNPPLNLMAESPLSRQVSLNWNAPVGFANAYFVERRVGAVGPFDRLTPAIGARFYGDVSASPGTTYTYRVRSLFGTNPDTGIASDPSNEVTITTPGAGPVGAIITVNASADGNARDAVMTLREALLIADGSLATGSLTSQELAAVSGTPLAPGLDVVAFAIPGPGPHTISLTSALPDVVDTIKIDGTTQAGFAGTPVVEINGSAVVALNTTGLRLLAPRSAIVGLAVGGFTGNGIFAGADEVVVSRCYAGVGPSGTTANPNGGSGIVVQGGVACFVDRCVASGNAVAGIEVAGPATGDTKITGCKMGTNAAGTAGIANGTGLLAGTDSGRIYVGGPSAAERCVISGNATHGVTAVGGSGVTLAGSYVGVDATGAAALPNGGDGVNAQESSCRIERGNVVSANLLAGLRYVSATPQSALTLIRGSMFGVASDGRSILANGGPGIVIVNQSVHLGSTLGQDTNVIAGNGGGGVLMVGSPFPSVIQGNFIGTNAFGDALGQPGDGIHVNGSSRISIGNGGPSGRNTIAFTGGAGIAIPAGTLNWIRWNSIYATGGLPIDLGPTGPTANDLGDGDTGGNDLQNAPVLTGAMLDGPSTIVTGYVDSLPLVDIRVELVERTTGSRPSRPLAVVDVTTDANGHADFNVSFVATIEPGTRMAALASHKSLSFVDADTSETSNAAPVQGVSYGSDTPGIFIGSSAAFFLKNTSAPGAADVVFTYGPSPSSFVPVVGDWNGDGVDSGGLYDPATGAFFLRNTNTPGPADFVFTYGGGGLGLRPLAGDWNGDGVDTIGLYAPTTGAFFLRNSNSAGGADLVFTYGAGGLGVVPVAGDWNADGIDTVGIYFTASGAFLLRNTNSAGSADLVFSFGAGGAGIVPVTGDWNGDGTDSIGIYDTGGGVWFLKNLNTGGAADFVFGYGPPAVPLTGDWDGPGL